MPAGAVPRGPHFPVYLSLSRASGAASDRVLPSLLACTLDLLWLRFGCWQFQYFSFGATVSGDRTRVSAAMHYKLTWKPYRVDDGVQPFASHPSLSCAEPSVCLDSQEVVAVWLQGPDSALVVCFGSSAFLLRELCSSQPYRMNFCIRLVFTLTVEVACLGSHDLLPQRDWCSASLHYQVQISSFVLLFHCWSRTLLLLD